MTNRSEDKDMRAKNTLCKNTDYAKQKKQIKVVDNNVSPRGLSISVCLFCLFHSLFHSLCPKGKDFRTGPHLRLLMMEHDNCKMCGNLYQCMYFSKDE